MKKLLIISIGFMFLLTSFAVHSGLTTNANLHTTEVVLSQRNFKVVESVSGESQALYFLGIGGLSKQAMISEALAKMLSNANIVGGAKAIINETVEIKNSIFPIIRLYKVTISGHIIEFTE